jgi:hypothetical protein
VTDRIDTTPPDDSPAFAWHPEYTGRSVDSVHRELADNIRRDQLAYQAALESAEKEEHGAFTTVRDLEKRWSTYDFAWFELPPDQLADRIIRFEQERETRQELIDWNDWRNASNPVRPAATTTPAGKQDWRENLTDEQRRKLASGLAVAVIVLGIVLCLGLYLLVR